MQNHSQKNLDKIVLKESLCDIDFFKVLELGCGTGKNTEWLITKADSLIGLDFSKNMLDIAKNKIGKNILLVVMTKKLLSDDVGTEASVIAKNKKAELYSP